MVATEFGSREWLGVGSVKLKRYVHHPRLPFDRNRNLAFAKNLQHCRVVRQNQRDELLQSVRSSNDDQMPQQQTADSLPLVFIDHHKRDLSLSRAFGNIARPSHDRRFAVFISCCNEGYLPRKIHIYKEGNFGLGEVPPCGEKPAIHGLVTDPAGCRDKIISVLRAKRADRNVISVGESLLGEVIGDFHSFTVRLDGLPSNVGVVAGTAL